MPHLFMKCHLVMQIIMTPPYVGKVVFEIVKTGQLAG